MAQVEVQNLKWLIVHKATETAAKSTKQETYLEGVKKQLWTARWIPMKIVWISFSTNGKMIHLLEAVCSPSDFQVCNKQSVREEILGIEGKHSKSRAPILFLTWDHETSVLLKTSWVKAKLAAWVFEIQLWFGAVKSNVFVSLTCMHTQRSKLVPLLWELTITRFTLLTCMNLWYVCTLND